ncbi:Alpha-ribazole phosphatase [Trichostrongylus colubriformis]|uniref:Alpha-ribazole phosphatase n=1 Tax=Trichostrongylus colubriformis TaxID=6319 RepID=A0AAN8EZH6_TRICO
MSPPLRTIWVVRHAEREDNINRGWKKLPGGSELTSDNSMLSERGRTQAKECATRQVTVRIPRRFSKTDIAHVFASPFDRTIETASIIVANKNLSVKPEPGLCEALYLCHNPPGFWDADKLKEKFPLVDTDYVPVYSKHTLPKEGFGDDACIPRVRNTLNRITEKYDGDLLLVSHGAPIGAIHEIWGKDFTYVGQATVTKFVEVQKGKFRMEFSSDASHLSDKSNLRPW